MRPGEDLLPAQAGGHQLVFARGARQLDVADVGAEQQLPAGLHERGHLLPRGIGKALHHFLRGAFLLQAFFEEAERRGHGHAFAHQPRSQFR